MQPPQKKTNKNFKEVENTGKEELKEVLQAKYSISKLFILNLNCQ